MKKEIMNFKILKMKLKYEIEIKIEFEFNFEELIFNFEI